MNEITPKTFEQIEKSIDNNPAMVYLVGLQPTGRRSQKQALDSMAALVSDGKITACQFFPWHELRFQHVVAIRAKLTEVYKPATVNKFLCALRKTLRSAWQLGMMTSEDYQRAVDVQSVNGETIPAGRELEAGELAALMVACESDKSISGIRDAAIIGLLYSCGLRRDEAVNLDLSDFEPSTGKMIVTGKRNKERTAYLINGAAHAMKDWIAVRGNMAGALFQPVNKSGKVIDSRMTSQAIYNLLQKRGEMAGIDKFSPHDLRRTFVGDLLDAGADITTVSKMAGHASVNTTARYDRRPEEAKIKAAHLLHIPYRGKGK